MCLERIRDTIFACDIRIYVFYHEANLSCSEQCWRGHEQSEVIIS